ncbi:MAG: hypothetical protein AAF713_16665 [Pseudomonadota bacterium]
MILARIVMVVLAVALVGAVGYFSHVGAGGESGDVVRSLRPGSVGGPGIAGRVK